MSGPQAPGGPQIGPGNSTSPSPRPPVAQPVAQPARKPGAVAASSKTMPVAAAKSPPLPTKSTSPAPAATAAPVSCFCSECGNQLAAAAKFCSVCGTRTAAGAGTPSAASSAVTATSPTAAAAPIAASSSLASFYGDLGSTASSSSSGGTGPSALDVDASGPEGQPNTASPAMSAAAFYAAQSQLPTPKGSVNSSNSGSVAAAAASTPTSSATRPPLQRAITSPNAAASASASASASAAPFIPRGVPSILQTIAAKFDNPPINLCANPHRVLLKEGFLQRQATFKNVSRYCYLFNDLFIVTEPLESKSGGAVSASSPAAKKLTMKQVVELEVADLIPGKKATNFILANPEKELWFQCGSEGEAAEWSLALQSAIEARKARMPSAGAAGAAASASAAGGSPGQDSRSLGNKTLFTAIAKKDDQLLLDLLSERGDDPNMLDATGRTPLHRCVMNGFTIGVTLLLSHGADMSLADPDGKSALHLAGLYDSYAILMIFLSRKPELDKILDMDGRSALWDLICGPYRMHVVPESKEEEEARGGDAAPSPLARPLSKKGTPKRQLLRMPSAGGKGDVDEPATDSEADEDDEPSQSQSQSQSQSGAASPVSPMSPSQKDRRSLVSIQKDSWKNLRECVKVMIEQNIDVEAKDAHGQTLSMHLSATHSHESLELLLQEGASLSCIDDRGATALHYAVCPELSNGLVDDHDLSDVLATVQILLVAGLCPNLRDNNLNTSLHLTKSLPIAGCLIVHGARPDLKNDLGIRATAYFEDSKDAAMLDAAQAIKEARESWNSRPETYLPPNEHLESNQWLDDELSDCCLLCNEKFSLTKRRHHCRRCGMLVCSNCSSKKFQTANGKETGLRACDGCYNFMSAKASRTASPQGQHTTRRYLILAKKQRRARAAAREEAEQLARDKAEVAANFEASHRAFVKRQADEEARINAKLQLAEERKANPDKAIPPPNPTKRTTGAAAGAGAAASSSDALSATSKKSASTHAQMSQNKQMALERGEKLNQMEDKAARMENDAENFATMAAKLKEKQKNSWW